MAMTPVEFWGENYYNHPPLTPELLKLCEEKFGVKLPLLLVELLQFQNGGYTNDFGYPMAQETSWAKDHVPLNGMSGIVDDPNIQTSFNLLESDYYQREWNLPPKQLTLNGDGHWWITLDYRFSARPSVLWIDTEEEEMIPIAPTFEIFYAGLRSIAEFQVED
jgi:hypothetical protein